MKARQAVVCANCGALNRPTWEFCARCNEALEGALPVEEGATAADAAEAAGARSSSGAPAAIAMVTVLGMVVIGLAGWRYAANAPPIARPDPALFTMATLPTELPTPPPVTGAGADDFLEGRRLLTAGDVDGAVARFAAAAEADPQNAEYHKSYGNALWRSGDREAALAQHAEAAQLDSRLQLQYARTLDVAGHGAEAAAQYEAILAQSPAAITVHEDLGRLLFRNGDYAKAASHLQKAVQARPDDPVLTQELAYSLDQAGDRGRAAAMYREVLARAPQAVMSRGLLAESLVQDGKSAEAVSLLREGIKDTPAAPLLHRELGSVLERAGQPAEAAAAYRTYARLAPNAADARDLANRAARLAGLGNP